jgi:hypothetical protein
MDRSWMWKLAGRAAAALLAAFLVAVLVDVLAVVAWPAAWDREQQLLRGPRARAAPWEDLQGRTVSIVGTRSLALRLRDDRLTATWSLQTSRDDPLLRLVQEGRADEDPDGFVRFALGTIGIAQAPDWLPESPPRPDEDDELRFERPTVLVKPGSVTAEIRSSSKPYELRLQTARVVVGDPMLPAKHELIVSAERLVIRAGDGGWTRWETGSAAGFRRDGAGVTAFDVRRLDPPTGQARLVSLGTVQLPIIGGLLVAIMEILPYLLVLSLLHKASHVDAAARWRPAMILLVAWYLGVALLDAAISLDLTADYLRPITSRLVGPSDPGPLEMVGPYGLAVVGTLLLLPLAVRRSLRRVQTQTGRGRWWWLRGALVAVMLAGAFVAVLWFLRRSGQLTSFMRPGAQLAGGVLIVAGLFLASLVLCVAALGRRYAALVAAAATLLLAAVALLAPALLRRSGDLVNPFRVGAFLLLVAAMTAAFAVMAWMVARTPGSSGRPVSRAHHAFLPLVALVALVPVVPQVLPLDRAGSVGPWSAFRVAYALHVADLAGRAWLSATGAAGAGVTRQVPEEARRRPLGWRGVRALQLLLGRPALAVRPSHAARGLVPRGQAAASNGQGEGGR